MSSVARSTDRAKRQLIQASGSTSSRGRGSQSLSASKGYPDRSWPTNETDITTPSLCSDNERDGDGSLEDRAPSTPPGPRSTQISTHKSKVGEPEIIDVDMEPPVVPSNSAAPLRPRGRPSMFERRPPKSPIPKSPASRKPLPPARTRKNSTPKPKYVPPASDSDDDADHSKDMGPVPFLSLIPSSRPAVRRKGTVPTSAADASSRHATLDEELWVARARALTDRRQNSAEELEDVFVGSGTKAQPRGSLGHGGPPVFIGGVEGDTEVGSRRTVRRSLIPRAKGKS